MRQLLMIAAIYSLIIHQSQKQAKQKLPPVLQKANTKTAISFVPRQQPILAGRFSYDNSGLFISFGNNASAKLTEME